MFTVESPWQGQFATASAACLPGTVALATHASFALFGERVMSLPGAKVRASVAKRLCELDSPRVTALYSASRWLGTARSAALIAVVELTPALRASLREAHAFDGRGRWEDVAMYAGRRILCWTSTHDRVGVVYDGAEVLREAGLRPVAAAPIVIRAERLDATAEAEILGRRESRAR